MAYPLLQASRLCNRFLDIADSSLHLQDPEGILAAPKGGHISRRTFQKQLAEDKTLAEQVERERETARQELQARRDVSGSVLPCMIP